MRINFCKLLSIILISGCSQVFGQNYITHEWGTFTTLSGSDGKQLPGLYLEEEQLPVFVHSHTGFSPDPNTQKGIFKPCYHATVKLETPVLYFYSSDSLRIKVKVGFQAGTISQWYPQRSGGEASNTDTAFDFSKSYNGSINWDAKILEPGNKSAYSASKSEETNTWVAPRTTDANLVSSNNEIEKFLFYRGVGNFQSILKTEINTNSELVVTNTSPDSIPMYMVFEKRTNDSFYFYLGGKLHGNQTVNVKLKAKGMDSVAFDGVLYFMKDMLMRAGLYDKEAKAMVNTWYQSYFGTHGLRVFWIVPRKVTDSLLPLTLSPKPTSLARVLVGRNEVLRPEFENQLVTDFDAGKSYTYKSDRYFLAYQARYNVLKTTGINSFANYPSTPPVLTVYPNPFAKRFAVDLVLNAPTTVKLQVLTLSGVVKLNIPAQQTNGAFHQDLDFDQYPSGIYIIKVEAGGQQFVERVFKD